ncbi:MAG: cupin domain-containing protein, partial [Pseudomonadota bacterium]
PDKAAMRERFLAEHTHSEDEVRFFVDGEGLFTLHLNDHVFEVLCQRGELISVPANTPHWFDMGPNPSFVAIRLFNNPEGWVANFTGSDIANRFSRLEN